MRKNLLITLVLIVALLSPNLSLGASGLSVARADGGGHFVRVPAGAFARADPLGLTPSLALDYGSFYWLELGDADFAALSASDIPFTHAPDAGKIQIAGFKFDPLLHGEPDLPASMQTDGTGPGFRLLQFIGPAQDDWLAHLQAAGLPILQYYPHNSFLTWATPNQNLQDLPFVRWQGDVHPGYKIDASLVERSGLIDSVDVMFYNDGNVQGTLDAIVDLGGKILHYYPSQPDEAFFDAIVQLDAAALEEVARLNTVLWLGYSSPDPTLDDEMSTQIVAGNYVAGVPVTGYFSWLSQLGYDGTGVIWSITDTGVDYDHPDLSIVGGYTYPGCPAGDGPGDDPATGGHGTHVAGITGGDATGGYTDPDGFFYGLGIAPGYSVFAQNPICGTQASWPPAGGWQELSKQGVLGNAIGANNSWTSGEGTPHGYQATERTHDFMVRDGNFDTTTVAEPYILVFSAGNSGPGASTLTSPKEAKNLIVTAGTQNYRVSGNIDAMYNSSSRGPAVDGRYVPTIATPGQQIASTRNDLGGSCGTAIPGTNGLYSYCTGTSMAAPHTSGSIVLITEWWRTVNAGANPSPAMAKAILANGAVDISGAPPIPNFDEGWGRINLTNVLTDNVVYRDQLDLLTGTGQVWQGTLGVADPSKPLKVSLAWSDAPGAVGANPALVNDLNLTVVNDGNTYHGNQFSGGWSVPGGGLDNLNNLENVFVQNPGPAVQISVSAFNLPGDGVPYNGDTTDQDFALVCWNCVEQADFTLSAEPDAFEVCAPEPVTSTIEVGQLLSYSHDVTLAVHSLPTGVLADINPITVTPPGTALLTLDVGAAAAPGDYVVVVSGTAELTNVHTSEIDLHINTSAPASPALLSPANGQAGVGTTPVFSWTAAAQANLYLLQVASDPGFGNVVYSATVSSPSHTVQTPLDTNTLYYWRVQASNACGTSNYSDVFYFQTLAISCQVYDSTDVPLPIPEGGGTSGTTTSDLTVADSGAIYDVNVLNLVGTHTYMGDLDFFLDSPQGTQVQLMEQACGTAENFDLNLDDEAAPGPWPCPPTDGGTYQPSQPLSGFDDEDSAGDWMLTIVDNYTGDTGQLQSWSLEICVGVDSCISPTVSLESNSPVELGQAMHFSASLTAGTLPVTYTWDFGDGSQPVVGMGLNVISHTYTAENTYTVTLLAENGCGQDTTDIQVVVNPASCQGVSIDALESDSPVELGQAMHFSATVSGETPISYTWDFGGTGSGSGLNTATPTFTYTSSGLYTVWLTASNACPSSDAGTIDVVVTPTAVCTDLQAIHIHGISSDLPGVYTFSTSYEPANASTPIEYVWDNGDLTAHTARDLSLGLHTLVVTATNPCTTPAVTDVHRVTIVEPDIDLVLPPEHAPVPPDATYTEILEINNTGGYTLSWALDKVQAIDWLTEAYTQGETLPNGSFPVTLTFDATDLTDGVYTGTLLITSDDPDEPMVYVPVTLTVFTEPNEYTLTTSVDPAGSGSVRLDPTGGIYQAGTVVTLTAAPASAAWEFSHWTGDEIGGSTSVTETIIMNADYTVTAVFSSTGVVTPTYTLTVLITPTDAGSVDLNPAGGVYEQGTSITLTANAAVGYEFVEWFGDLSGNANPAALTMMDDYTVTAAFSKTAACVEVDGVSLALLTSGTIRLGDAVDVRADVSPDGFSAPYTYTVDYGDGTIPITATNSDDPLSLQHVFATTGVLTVEIWLWNCEMSLPVSDSLQINVAGASFDIYLPIVVKND